MNIFFLLLIYDVVWRCEQKSIYKGSTIAYSTQELLYSQY